MSYSNFHLKSKTLYSGFSTLEILSVISLIAVVTGFALPAYSNLIHNQQKTSISSQFIQSVILARSQSAIMYEDISICPSDNGSTCLQNSTNFSKGWISFVNSDQDYPVKRDQTEELLQTVRLKVNSLKILSNRKAFTFRPNSKRNTNGTLMLCPEQELHHHETQAIIISYTGRPRIDKSPKKQHLDLCSL